MRERACVRACVGARVCGCGAFEMRGVGVSEETCQPRDVAAEHRPKRLRNRDSSQQP
jgi:hypothetical protein